MRQELITIDEDLKKLDRIKSWLVALDKGLLMEKRFISLVKSEMVDLTQLKATVANHDMSIQNLKEQQHETRKTTSVNH